MEELAKIKFEHVNGNTGEIELSKIDDIRTFIDKYIIDKRWFTIVDKEGKGIAINLNNVTNIKVE